MVVLFDYDSLIYLSVYKIVSFTQIREWLSDGLPKEVIREQIVYDSVARANKMTLDILEDIEKCGIQIDGVEYFVTTCRKSIRKAISKEYKAKRKRNNWVGKVRKVLVNSLGCHHSDEWEADDLIADYSKKEGEYLICSIDKDLQQLEGWHYNYKMQYAKDEQGNKVATQRKGLSHTSASESVCFLATQMLMGDAGDGIQGIKGIGKLKAGKLLKDCNNQFSYLRRIVEQYYTAFGEDARTELMKNYRLLKLGTI